MSEKVALWAMGILVALLLTFGGTIFSMILERIDSVDTSLTGLTSGVQSVATEVEKDKMRQDYFERRLDICCVGTASNTTPGDAGG